MHESVRRAWVPVNAAWEGVVPWMYADVLGLITVGIGNLIDRSSDKDEPQPWRDALSLPFVRPNGTPATQAEIRAAWQAVKSRPELAQQGHRVAARYSTLRLTAQGIEDVVLRKLDANHVQLRKRYTAIDSWPADAVFATHSMAWACGGAFGYAGRYPFRKLDAALQAFDFDTAADECTIREEGNPGVIPRNKANRAMYRNAARVLSWKLDPSELHYPTELLEVPMDPTPRPSPVPSIIQDTSAVRQAGTSEAMREHFAAMPPVIIVDDTKGENE
jgi:hypothetical protein